MVVTNRNVREDARSILKAYFRSPRKGGIAYLTRANEYEDPRKLDRMIYIETEKTPEREGFSIIRDLKEKAREIDAGRKGIKDRGALATRQDAIKTVEKISGETGLRHINPSKSPKRIPAGLDPTMMNTFFKED